MHKTAVFSLLIFALLCTACEFQEEQTNTPDPGHSGLDLSLMDTMLSPSEDFYRYVNGAWLDNAEFPAGRGRWGSFDELRVKTMDKTLRLLDDSSGQNEFANNTDKGKALLLYHMGMDTNRLNAEGLTPLRPILKKIDAIQSKEELLSYLAEDVNRDGGQHYSLQVRPDYDNSNLSTLYFNPGATGLPEREYYLQSDSASLAVQEKYKAFLAKVFAHLDYVLGTDAEEKIEDVFALEKAMEELKLPKEERRNTTLLNNPYPLAELDAMLGDISLSQILDAQGISGPDTITVPQVKYVEGLEGIIDKFTLETQKKYLRWMGFRKYGRYLDTKSEDLLFSFYDKVLRGVDEPSPRNERVLKTTNRHIGEAIGKLYVDAYFPPEAKQVAEEMIANIRKAFAARIGTLDWMSEVTKEKALDKLDKFNVKIAYPDEWKDYSAMEILPEKDGGSYMENVRQAKIWNWEKDLSELGKEVNKEEWFTPPQTVNAFYNASFNEIVFPAAILQAPFFDFEADPAVNYGGIGAVIGHEFSHGFDDRGSRFDGEGNLENWWTEEDRTRFDERTAELIAQYDTYSPLKDVYVNGEYTLGENIGDLGGVNLAFDGLQLHLAKEEIGKIDGFTQNQRFFMSWATIWRTIYKDETLRKQIKTDPHSPGQYRATGPLVNVDSFYSAFDIDENSPLYKAPENRIVIW